MAMGLNQYDKLWWIALGFGGFGFFGYAFFPLILELAVEETFPIGKYNTKVSNVPIHTYLLADASISEALIHMNVNITAILGTVLSNVMYLELGSNAPNTCQIDNANNGSGVQARDYSPYYYLIMCMGVLLPITCIFLMKPSMKRSQSDEQGAAGGQKLP